MDRYKSTSSGSTVSASATVTVADNDPFSAVNDSYTTDAGTGLPVEFVLGNVERLPFADGAFTACRSERMFQHTSDPLQAMRELARVTRSGGQVVVFDTDWETLIVDAADVATTRAIIGSPAMSASGLPGSRVEASRAGMRMMTSLAMREDAASRKSPVPQTRSSHEFAAGRVRTSGS